MPVKNEPSPIRRETEKDMTPGSTVTPTVQRSSGNESGAESSSVMRGGWFASYRDVLLFTCFAAAYILPFMWLFSAGLLESDAVRVLHGQVFGRDFFEVMTPGTFYWNAAFMRIFGVGFLGARACLFVTSLGTAVCMYLLARRIAPAYRWLPPLVVVITFFGRGWPFASHHTDSNFFALLAVYCAVYGFDRRSRLAWFGAGLLTAVTGLTLQPKGALLLAAILLWMVVMKLRHEMPLSAMAIFVGGVCLAGGAAVLYFWSQGALYDVYYANFLWPLRHYSKVNTVPYGDGTLVYWTPWFHSVSGVPIFAWLAPVTVTPFLFVDALPLILAGLAAFRWRENFKPVILLYWLCGAALWLAEIHRKEIAHLAIGSTLWLILAFYFLVTCRGRWATYAVKILAICSVAVGSFNLLMVAHGHPLKTRAGTVLSVHPVPGLKYLDKHMRPGEYLFAYPYIPQYYFLTGTQNPTRYSLLIYNYNTQRQFKKAIEEIQKHKVRFIVWQTDMKQWQKLLPGCTRRPPYGFLMDDYIRSHYRMVASYPYHGYEIWERNGDE